VRIVTGVVDPRHEAVGGHGDMHATFDRSSVGLIGTIPQACKRKYVLIVELDQIWSLATILIQVPFVEAGCELKAALAAVPRPSIGGRCFEGLDTSVDGRVLGRLAFCESSSRRSRPLQT
jgi:hypothetical protein